MNGQLKNVAAGLILAAVVVLATTIWVSMDNNESASAVDEASGMSDPSLVKHVLDRVMGGARTGRMIGLPDSFTGGTMSYRDALAITGGNPDSSVSQILNDRPVVIYRIDGLLERVDDKIKGTTKTEQGYFLIVIDIETGNTLSESTRPSNITTPTASLSAVTVPADLESIEPLKTKAWPLATAAPAKEATEKEE